MIDDLQWAEPVFVDLVEHVADLSRDAPIFLLCVARTELLDVRPGWGGGKLNATSLLLEPLGADECEELMERLVAERAARRRCCASASRPPSAGNPLFVEEMLAMVREHGGDGEIVVPPTIHALLQARIDSLDGDVRVVMERGSVEGEVFHRGAVAALVARSRCGRRRVAPRDARSQGAHPLDRVDVSRRRGLPLPPSAHPRRGVRVAAEGDASGAPRAASPTGSRTHELVEGDEIVGYHLEQAHRYRAELDPGDPSASFACERVSDRLAAAGSGALDRGDFNAVDRCSGERAAILRRRRSEARSLSRLISRLRSGSPKTSTEAQNGSRRMLA